MKVYDSSVHETDTYLCFVHHISMHGTHLWIKYYFCFLSISAVLFKKQHISTYRWNSELWRGVCSLTAVGTTQVVTVYHDPKFRTPPVVTRIRLARTPCLRVDKFEVNHTERINNNNVLHTQAQHKYNNIPHLYSTLFNPTFVQRDFTSILPRSLGYTWDGIIVRKVTPSQM